MWRGNSSKTNLLGWSALHWTAFSCPRVPVLQGTCVVPVKPASALPHSAGRRGPRPFCPSCVVLLGQLHTTGPWGTSSTSVHSELHWERRSRYIPPLSITQWMCFFFFFTVGQYKQRWHFSFPEAQGNFYCFTSSCGTLKNQSVQSAGPRGCLDAP